ncbi:MAG: 2-isopropylmalate synthase, partial [Planctomycetota bacterium]|nr:2-isopropylmalate synthase [Planctomycetota bacterium]
DAVFHALERLTGISARLQNYQVRSLTVGKEAQGEVLVEIVYNNQVFHGRAASTDIIEASAHSYLKALNKAAQGQAGQPKLHAQHAGS